MVNERVSNLAAEVDDVGVRVVKRQQDPTPGVQLLQCQRLPKVFLLMEKQQG